MASTVHTSQAMLLKQRSTLPMVSSNWTFKEGNISYGSVDARYFKNFIVVPELKLLFCTIEKAGDLSFNTLFRIIRAKYDPSQLEGRAWRRNSPEMHNLTNKEIIDRILDPEWHKAVFVREPLERYVSAYMSKCLGADEDGYIHCGKQFGNEHMEFNASVKWILDFDRAGGSDLEFDPHFMKQINFCGHLDSSLQYYSTVEELDRTTSHQNVAEMLRKVGVDAANIEGFNELFPAPTQHGWEDEGHNTNAKGAFGTYVNPQQPWIADALQKHYREDYEVLHIRYPNLPMSMLWGNGLTNFSSEVMLKMALYGPRWSDAVNESSALALVRRIAEHTHP